MSEDAQTENAANLELWNSVKSTDPKYTKDVSYGRKFTAVDPTYQNQLATGLWGPQGGQWGLRDMSYSIVEAKAWDKQSGTEYSTSQMILSCVLFYPNGEIPIIVDKPFKPNDDTAKKLRTAAKSKALAELGFSADVYLGQFDDDAYVADQQVKYGEQDAVRTKALASIKTAKSEKALEAIEARINGMIAHDTIDPVLGSELKTALAERWAKL